MRNLHTRAQMSGSDSPVVMVSGQQWVSRRFFEQHYTHKLLAHAAQNARFVLGAADGVDTYAQQTLAELCDAGLLDPERVTIFNKGAKDGRALSTFRLRNGFASYPERDRAMCVESSVLVCTLAQYGCGTSGAALNVLRAAFGNDEAQAQIAFKALRAATERKSSDDAELIAMLEARAAAAVAQKQ